MQAQSEIKRRLSDPTVLAEVQTLASGDGNSRTAIARAVCERFGFYDARGRAQTAGCLKALGELARADRLALPAARSQPRPGQPRRLGEPVAAPQGIPDEVGAVEGLELVLVDSEPQMRIWNELMLREHPCGAGPLVGPQLRYLIGSAHGWLGGLGFSAAARSLHDRDAWIGWAEPMRRSRLHRVVSMSRFLLRPLGCRNLASHLLGAVLKRLAADFAARFGYRPYLVESFVDTRSFDGSCYRAANWIEVGQTRGRGRQDRAHRQPAGIKAIYVYPLVADVQTRLGGAAALPPPPLPVGAGLDTPGWAEQEFGGASLGDARLSRRLVASAACLAQQPGRAFTAVAKGDVAAIKGYYRLIDKADLNAVTLETILGPHQARTRQRMANESRVLCIADGTTLDYNGLAQTTGLGVTGSNQTGAQQRGIEMHSTLAINSQGVPLGIVDVRTRTPDAEAVKASRDTPLAQKKSFDWIQGLDSCRALAEQLPDTRITCVMDREADFFELFDHHREKPNVDLLIRAQYNRVIGGAVEPPETKTKTKPKPKPKPKLFDHLRESPARGTLTLRIDRQSARPKRSKQKARAARAAREATLTLHYERIELPPPEKLKDRAALTLWVVLAREKQPPPGVKPLQWCLLTSREIQDPEAAAQCLHDYALRWRIEDWHRVLKTGCRVEALAHQQVERLERAIAINLVIAWRIMVMTLLGREVPDLPAEILFSEIEIRVLSQWAKRVGAKPPTTLGEAIILVARIGGYTNRNNDPPPGHELMWHGCQNLNLMCMGYELQNA